jgi:hypothetical protein
MNQIIRDCEVVRLYQFVIVETQITISKHPYTGITVIYDRYPADESETVGM